MKKVFRETVSGFTHLGGAVLALIGIIFLILHSYGNTGKLITNLIFGISMVLLFSASATYHLVAQPDWLIKLLKKVDHCMIYVLIAGTYTPMIYATFTGPLRLGYLIGIWTFALAGIIMKIFYTGRFRTLSTILYLAMGWSIIFAIVPLVKLMSGLGLFFLMLGGIFYTIGGIIYALKKPNIWQYFGFHELFHIFVLLGAGAHYTMVLLSL